MDMFEYIILNVAVWIIGKEGEKENKVGVTIDSYKSDGTELGKKETERIFLEDETEFITPHGDWRGHTVMRNDSVDYLAPYLAKYGANGWEMVELKFATNPPFATAILKRRVQKE